MIFQWSVQTSAELTNLYKNYNSLLYRHQNVNYMHTVLKVSLGSFHGKATKWTTHQPAKEYRNTINHICIGPLQSSSVKIPAHKIDRNIKPQHLKSWCNLHQSLSVSIENLPSHIDFWGGHLWYEDHECVKLPLPSKDWICYCNSRKTVMDNLQSHSKKNDHCQDSYTLICTFLLTN